MVIRLPWLPLLVRSLCSSSAGAAGGLREEGLDSEVVESGEDA